jgi:hypothetical protein
MRPGLRLIAALGVLTPFTVVLTGTAAAGAVAPSPLLAAARLSGTFVMTGAVTKAVGVPGERAGDTIHRTWAFLPLCASGPCTAVELVRSRQGGTDRVLLHQRGPAFYTGVGTFLAPTRCHGVRYRKGVLVPFTISLRVVTAAALGSAVQATGVSAFYRNRKRLNLTKCFAAPSYDSARYLGALLPPPPSS